MKKLSKFRTGCLFSLALISVFAFGFSTAQAQTTAFNFQGRLNDGNNPANGRYDLQFKLYNQIAGGNPVGATIDRPNLLLINGVFSTTLDFGNSIFTGIDRFIEISLRPATSGTNAPNAYVILGPRQQILSVPYSIRSATSTYADQANSATNAQNFNGFSASHFVQYSGNGNVGIDIDSPPDKFTVKTPANSYGIIQTDGSVQVGTSVGIAGSGELVGGFGTKSNHTLRFFTNGSGSGGMTLDTNSNVRQPSNANGLVKAMARIDRSGEVNACYNSNEIGNSATIPPCGISVNHFTAGGFGINFHFPIGNRFISITSSVLNTFGGTNQNTGAYYEGLDGGNASSVNVRTYVAGDTETTTDADFVIIVY